MNVMVHYEVLEETGEYTYLGNVFFRDYDPTTSDIINSAVDLIDDPRTHKYRFTIERFFK